MNAGKAVYGILSANSGVTDIVGTRIFPEIAEQEAATPFIVYQLLSVDPEDTHDGPSKLDEVRFEFLCYADSYNEAADLGVAVRAALDRVSGTYNGVHVESVQFNDVDVEIEYDPRRYSQVLKFTFRIKRDDVTIALGTPVTGAVLGDLSDVDVTGVTNGQLIAYNSTSGNWEAANDAGGAEQLNDLSDVIVSLPASGEVLKYDGGEFVNDNISISDVINLQSELDATPDSLDDLTDVKIVGTPTDGDALVYSSGFWSRGTAGASTLGDLTDVNTTGASAGSLLSYNGVDGWDISASQLPSDAVYYHNRYASEAETLLDGATETVELYYTAQADGDGLHEDAQTDTATTGYDIRRKLYYAEKAQADPNTSGDWTQFTAIADDTTFASAKATLLAYLKARTGGTVPISLKMTWEEVAKAPAFTGLLNESYGSGAAAAYSTRRLNGNVTECMVIRRASDSTTTTIGFDGSGNIDEAAINTFCSGTTCTVQTWKDQSGNGNDATQATAANQPTIYTGGAIVKENGRVKAEFDGVDDFMQSTITDTSQAYDIYSIFKYNTTPTNIERIYDSGTGGRITRGSSSSTNEFIFSGTALNWSYRQTIQVQETHVYNGSNSVARVSGTETASGNAGSNSTGTNFVIGARDTTADHYLDGSIQELILFDNSKSTGDRTSVEENQGDYFTQNTPLLDTYTGAAAAYSLRKLRTAYSGSAIRVRRASDNAEQDIGFNVFGELDTVSLASFCSGTDGFVKTWYDQSGNANDATQTNTANQPKIYDSVTGVVTENGKPAVDFDGTDDTLETASTDILHGSSWTAYLTLNPNPSSTAVFITGGSNATGQARFLFDVTGTGQVAVGYSGFNSGTSLDTYTKNTQNLIEYYATNHATSQTASVTSYVNGSGGSNYTSTSVVTAATNASLGIGGQTFLDSQYTPMKAQELIFYASDQSSNRTNIESNINTFYSIY